MATDWARGLLISGDEMPDNWQDLADYLDVKTVNISTELVTEDIVKEIIDLDLKPLVYTVNDPILARQLQGWGIEAMFSDEPDVILENLLTVH